MTSCSHVSRSFFESKPLETHFAGRDVLGILVTGFEKELNLPSVLSGKASATNPNTSGFLISPLNSIIEERVGELTKLGLSAVLAERMIGSLSNLVVETKWLTAPGAERGRGTHNLRMGLLIVPFGV